MGHFLQYGNFNIGADEVNRLLIIGGVEEAERTKALLQGIHAKVDILGVVSPQNTTDKAYLGSFDELDKLVQLFQVQELIFCSKDIDNQVIMESMEQIGPSVLYKIVPKNGDTIIGSSSKNASGQLYTARTNFEIASLANRRNKRVFDALAAAILLLLMPIIVWLVDQKMSFIENCFLVLLGKKTWVGYQNEHYSDYLPKIKPAVIDQIAHTPTATVNAKQAEQLNFLYAKNYTVNKDIFLLIKGFKALGT